MFSGCLCICANCASVLHPGGGSPDGLQSNSSFSLNIVILSLLFMCFPTPVSSCTCYSEHVKHTHHKVLKLVG